MVLATLALVAGGHASMPPSRLNRNGRKCFTQEQDGTKEASQNKMNIPEEVILSAAKDLPEFCEGFFAALRMTSAPFGHAIS